MRRKHWIIGGLLTIVAGMAVFTVWGVWSLLQLVGPPQTVTDPSQYGNVRAEWVASRLVDHFPPAIPMDAGAVRMSSFAGYLQGGAHFQLRLRLPAEEVRRVREDAAVVATREFSGGDWNRHANLPNGVPTTFFRTGDTGALAFPETYTIFVLRALDRGQGSWNHGESCGVAVDEQNLEVVYWADLW